MLPNRPTILTRKYQIMEVADKSILYFETGPNNKPTLSADLGEEFEVITQMNHGSWLDNHPDGLALSQKLRAGNPSSVSISLMVPRRAKS